MEASMRIVIVGAGAIGGITAALLKRGGHDVTLVCKHQDIATIASGRGLHVTGVKGDMTVPVRAVAAVEELSGKFDLALIATKAYDMPASAKALLPFLTDEAFVLSLQNGVDNAERLQAAIGHPVIPAVVYVATEMAGPGHVRHHGRGELVIAPSPASADVAATLGSAGVPVQVSDNVAGALWAKLVLNCAYNALSAITRLPYGEIMNNPGLAVPQVMQDIVHECQRVAQARGIALPADTLDAVLHLAATMPGQMSSTAQDLARGKRSEIDHLNGYIVRRGEALGIATPVNRLLHTLVRLLERHLPAQAGGAA